MTADAMHAQRAHAEYLVHSRGAHYVLTVKRNQPSLVRREYGRPSRWADQARRTPTLQQLQEAGSSRVS